MTARCLIHEKLMSRFAVILPAAGCSSRFEGFNQKKPFVLLRGISVWQRSVAPFQGRDDVAMILLVIAPSDRTEFISSFGRELDGIQVISGGSSRAESIWNALAAVPDEIDFVAIHDAVRPLITGEAIGVVFQAAMETGAAIPALPVTSTVKEVSDDGRIAATVSRTRLRLTQTPQVFGRRLLQDAYRLVGDRLHEFTDDASLVEVTGHPVAVVEGWQENIKITTAEDFRLAELLLRN